MSTVAQERAWAASERALESQACAALGEVLRCPAGARYKLRAGVAGVARAGMVLHDPDGLWGNIEPGFQRRLPAVRFKWGGRTLHELQVSVLQPDDPTVAQHVSAPLDAYRVPYLHLYVCKCESLEQYKAVAKPRIKAWVEEVRASNAGLETTEWLVVYVPLLFHSENDQRLSAACAKVFERLKADFGQQGRVLRITLYKDAPADSQQGLAGDGEWAEMMRSVCKCIVAAFGARCNKFEGQVLKLEEQAHVPGWNYCTYLVVKENLAFTWLQLGQYYDALRIFDSLGVQLDSITGPEQSSKHATDRLSVDLFNAQAAILRATEEDHRSAADGGAGGIGNSAPSANGDVIADSDADADTPIIMQSKKIAGRLTKRVSNALSFGPGGAEAASAAHAPLSPASPARARADSMLRRVSETEAGHATGPELPAVLLDVRRRPYREQIYKSAISMLEIRLYLFVRSALLLLTIGRADEALRRAAHFISSFSRAMITGVRGGDAAEAAGEAELIAAAWAASASLEMICAGHAANAARIEKDHSPHAWLYQAELAGSAAGHLLRMLRLAGPGEDGAAPEELAGPELDCKWLLGLPRILLCSSSPSSTSRAPVALLQRDSVREWLPPGLVAALSDMGKMADLLDRLLSLQAGYVAAAGRPRNALRLSLRRVRLRAARQEWTRAADLLEELGEPTRDGDAPRAALGPMPVLDAELDLLRSLVLTKLGRHQEVVPVCLRVLCLHGTRREQRRRALKMLQEAMGAAAPRRTSGRRFPLFHGSPAGTSSRSASTEAEPARPGRVHRVGEQIVLQLDVESTLPEPVRLERVYTRFRAVKPASGTVSPASRDMSRQRADQARTLVRYRSTELSPDVALLAEPLDDAWIDGEGSDVGGDDGLNVPLSEDEEDLEDDQDDEVTDHGSEAESTGDSGMPSPRLPRPPPMPKQHLLAQLDADPEELSSPLPPDAKSMPRSGGRGRQLGRSLLQSQQQQQQQQQQPLIYLEAQHVEVAPGKQRLELRSGSRSNIGAYAPGTYVADRVVFVMAGGLDLVLSLAPRDVAAGGRFQVVSMPALFAVEVADPTAAFLPLDDAPARKVPVHLALRALAPPGAPRIDAIDATVELLDMEFENAPLRQAGGQAEGTHFSSKDLQVAPEDDRLLPKTIAFDLEVSAQPSAEVDMLVVPRQAEQQTVRKKGLARSQSSLGVTSCNLQVELRVTVSDGPEAAPLSAQIVQSHRLRLRYGAPFEVRQSVRLALGKLWVAITLHSNLPYRVDVGSVALETARLVSNVDTFSVAPRHDLQLVFVAEVPEEDREHRLAFSARYTLPGFQAEGRCEKAVCLRKVSVPASLHVAAACANLHAVRVGSTATFVFTLERDEGSFVQVEPIFADAGAAGESSLLTVSASPLVSRSRRVAHKPAGKPGQDLVAYSVAFDPAQWMIVGTERGRVDLALTSQVSCEFVPLRSGELAFPVLEVINEAAVKQLTRRSTVTVADP